MPLTKTAVAASLGLLVATALPAFAQTPQFVASHRDWTLYQVDSPSGKVCYIASEPAKQEGDYKQRGNPAVIVARLPGDPPTEQVSVQPGYAYKKASSVQVDLGNRKFELFTQGEHAWARNDVDDKALIEAMRRGSSMTARGTSVRDSYSLDTYSLAGFGNAYQAMRDACKD